MTASPALRGQGFRGAAITLADRAQLNNDAFEHPAGDALLVRLSDRRARALPDAAGAYRMGGDEFCVLAAIEGNEGAAIARQAATALSETGEAFDIGCSYGVAQLPHEASTPEGALRIADQRM